MKLDVESLVERVQRSAGTMDIGDVTSQPRSALVTLSKEELIDLLVDAWHCGRNDTTEALIDEVRRVTSTKWRDQ